MAHARSDLDWREECIYEQVCVSNQEISQTSHQRSATINQVAQSQDQSTNLHPISRLPMIETMQDRLNSNDLITKTF